MVNAAKVLRVLSPIGENTLPTCESQIRPLVGLSEDQLHLAWKNILQDAGEKRVTAALVRKHAKAVASARKAEKPALRKRIGGAGREIEAALAELIALVTVREYRAKAEALQAQIMKSLQWAEADLTYDHHMLGTRLLPSLGEDLPIGTAAPAI
jgi:hypothetical protein